MANLNNNPKQVIVIRRDLKLRKASIAALAAKASAEFFLDNDDSDKQDSLVVSLTPTETAWINSGSLRVVLGVPTENALNALAFKAELAGLPCYFIRGPIKEDNKSFSESLETLCVAIGPDDADKIDEITGNLKLI